MFRQNGLLRKAAISVFANANKNSSLNKRVNYHVSHKAQNDLIIGGLAVAGSAMALQYALTAYNNYQKNKPQGESPSESEEAQETDAKTADPSKAKNAEAKSKPTSAGVSAFEMWFAKNFYDGGFEDKMSKREAALILGIRESASADRIKEAHRRILLLNHPDRGGSAFISAKVNEAKDMLIKGKN